MSNSNVNVESVYEIHEEEEPEVESNHMVISTDEGTQAAGNNMQIIEDTGIRASGLCVIILRLSELLYGLMFFVPWDNTCCAVHQVYMYMCFWFMFDHT